MTSTWKVSASGDWSNAADWNGGVPNSATAVASIAETGTYTVDIASSETFAVGSVTVNDAGATLQIDGTLNLTKTLTLTAGSLYLDGTINGGTIVDAAGTGSFHGGALNGVTYDGTLNLTATGAELFLTTGLTLAGAGGTGAGAINLTGNNSTLELNSSMTLDNATLNFGSQGSNAVGDNSAYIDFHAAGLTLTLGKNLTIDANTGFSQDFLGGQAGAVINNGTIDAGAVNSGFYITGNIISFTNNGAIAISNGDNVIDQSGSFANDGTITITGAGALMFENMVTTAQLGTIHASGGGNVDIAGNGTLNNAGATLSVGTGDALGELVLQGTIANGTIADGGSGVVFDGGTLSGVTYQGALDLTNSGALLFIENGITLEGAGGTGAGAINVTGNNAALEIVSSETLDNATLNIGAAGSNAVGDNSAYVNLHGASLTLTLGQNLVLDASTNFSDVYFSGFSNQADAIINKGTIDAGAGNSGFYVQSGIASFTNNGAIAISNGDYFSIDSGSFANAGTIGVASGSAIDFGGGLTLTTAELGSIDNSGTVEIDGTLNNAGATLAVGTGTALGAITLDGTIEGGVIADAGDGILFSNATFSGVTYEGALNLNANSAQLHVVNGLTVTGAGGSGPGTVNVTGASAALHFTTATIFDNATVNFGNINGSNDYIYADGVTLTLGAHLTIDSAGGSDTFSELVGSGAIVNDGTINAQTASPAEFFISPASFTNNGAIAVSNGNTLVVQSANFVNNGAISAASGGAVDLQTNLTTAQLGKVSASGGGVVEIDSGHTLNNTGATLKIGSGSALGVLLLRGTVKSGTIVGGAGAFSSVNGTLDGVTYDGLLDLSAGGTLNIADGITLKGTGGSGAGTANLTGADSELNFTTTTTFDNATVNLGNASGSNDYISVGSGVTLTLGAHLTIDSAGGSDTFSELVGSGAIVNDGAINAKTASPAEFFISVASFTNKGTISVANGDTLLVQSAAFTNSGKITATTNGTADFQTNLTTKQLGNVSASGGGVVEIDSGHTLTNTGATLKIGSGSALGTLLLRGTVMGGTIDGGAGALGAGNGTLDGVTYEGLLDLSAGGTLNIADGITLAGAGGSGAGTANLTGAGSELNFTTTTTFDNATVNLGNASGSNDYISVGSGVTLTLGAHLTIDSAGGSDTFSQLVGTGAIVNDGAIDAQTASPAEFFITVSTFTNNGTIAVSNGDKLLLQPVNFTNFAGGVLTGGTYEAEAGSTIELSPNAAITTDDATIILSGVGSVIEAPSANAQVTIDASLTAIGATGTLELLAGRNFTTASAFTNAGLLEPGGGTFTAASLTNVGGGALFGIGSVAASITNNGRIEASGGALSLAASTLTNLSGSTLTGGLYQADAASILELAQNVQIVTDDATIVLTGAASTIESFSTATNAEVALDATLTTIGATGALKLFSGRSFTTAAAFSNAGLLQLGNVTFTAASLSDAAGASLLGAGKVAATIANAGSIEASGGTLTLQKSVSGAGGFQIDAGATLSFGAAGTSTGGVVFNGAGATLALSAPANFTNTLSGLIVGDQIDLLKIAATSAVLNASNQLVVTNNGAAVATFTLSGSYAKVDFSTVSDGKGGTLIVAGPTIAGPATLTELSDQTVALTGFTLTDTAAAAANGFTLTLSDKSGLLSATAETGATVTGAGTTKLVLAGTVAGVQAELATLTYTGADTGTKPTLADTLTLTAKNSRGGSGSETTKITVDHLKPVTTVPGPEMVASGAVTAITGLSVSDSDPSAGTSTFTTMLTDKVGLLSATAFAGATVAGAGSKSLTLSGSLAAVNQELASLTYDGALTGAATKAVDTITVTTADGHGDSDKHAIAVTITPTGNALPNLALFVQYVAAGFADTRAGLGALPAFIPPMAHQLDLAAHH